jgi:hypothetical protein
MRHKHTVKFESAALLILLLLVAGSCKRESRDATTALTSSLMFDSGSPEVREALASPVDFRINDENFAQWEAAQRYLEALPRSEIPAAPAQGRTAVDRAVARLESSPYVRTAIERTGLSVRDFVLETIALAQATEAAQTGKSITRGSIPPENFQFVQRYTSRALYSRSRVARVEPPTYEWDADAADVMSNQVDADEQLRIEEAEHQAEMHQADMERQREEMEHQAEMQREEAERISEIQREQTEHQTELLREQKRDTVPVQR